MGSNPLFLELNDGVVNYFDVFAEYLYSIRSKQLVYSSSSISTTKLIYNENYHNIHFKLGHDH